MEPTNKTANINIKEYCNVLYTYTGDPADLDRKSILDDLMYWRGICDEYEAFKNNVVIPTDDAKPATKATKGRKAATPATPAAANPMPIKTTIIPEGFTPATKCGKCGADFSNPANFRLSSGEKAGRLWYGMDCTQCKTERNGNAYATRTFLKGDSAKPATPVIAAPESSDFDDMIPDDVEGTGILF